MIRLGTVSRLLASLIATRSPLDAARTITDPKEKRS